MPPERKTKALSGLKIENADEGIVSAVFATFGVIDHDGDVAYPETFEDGQKVRISAYNHKSWDGALPVGKGVIRVTENEAILDGQFFLNTVAGSDTFEVVKQMGELQEWSYALLDVVAEPVEVDGEKANGLKSVTVPEVSPVILGAGIDTRTLLVKGAEKLSEQERKQLEAAIGEALANGATGPVLPAQKQLAYELFERLRDAGRQRWGDDGTYVYVDDFEVDAEWAVFVVSAEDEPTRYVQVGFSRGENGAVTLAEEETEVQRTTGYQPKQREGMKLSEHLAAVVADVKTLNQRLADVVAKRAEQGKDLGRESRALAEELEPELKALREVLTSAADDDEAGQTVDLDLEAETAAAAASARLRL